MAKRVGIPTIQVFIVSWFPMYAREAATIQCISRERANLIVSELQESFAAYSGYDPLIHVDRTEVKASFCSSGEAGIRSAVPGGTGKRAVPASLSGGSDAIKRIKTRNRSCFLCRDCGRAS